MVPDVTLRMRLEKAVSDMMSAALNDEMKWGRDDCTLWAVEPIRRVLGYDPARRGRGRYRTRLGAIRFLGKGGLPNALRREARRFNWHRIGPVDARPGDLGMVKVNGVNSMAVCRARGWFVARQETGFFAFEAKQVELAFKVL